MFSIYNTQIPNRNVMKIFQFLIIFGNLVDFFPKNREYVDSSKYFYFFHILSLQKTKNSVIHRPY